MPYKRRYMRPCENCGNDTLAPANASKRTLCQACALERAITAATEMAAHSGPAWDEWLSTKGPKGRPRGNDRKV